MLFGPWHTLLGWCHAGPAPYDALLLVSFGGPEKPDDVVPFLRNVTAGRDIPDARLEEVGEHYFLFGGRSPINDQNRDLVDAIEADLEANGVNLPVYWGNRNWDPYLREALERMKADGITRVAAVLTSAYSSYSGCRQYRENLADAVAEVPGAPRIDRLRHYFNHPGFIESMVDATLSALADLPEDARRGGHIVFVTHSIPVSMNDSSGPRGGAYVAQHRASPPRSSSGCARRPGTAIPPSSSSAHAPAARRTPGWSRTSTTTCAPCGSGTPGRRGGADRVRLGPHGGHLRPRHTRPRPRPRRSGCRSRAPPRPVSTRGSWPWSATSCSSAAPSSAASRSSGRRSGSDPPWDVCPAGCCANPRGPKPALCGED